MRARSSARTICAALGLAAALSLSLLPASAGAKEKWERISDELSTGSGSVAATEAGCDIRAVEARLDRRHLWVKIHTRGPRGGDWPASLLINTEGGAKSAPEFYVLRSRIMKPGDARALPGPPARFTNARDVVWFTVPLSVIGNPRSLGVQTSVCSSPGEDVAPGGDYFGQTRREPIEPNYLQLGGRVISGRVMLDCAKGASSCQRLPVKGVRVKAAGGKGRTVSGVTDEDGAFALLVKKGRYKVRTRTKALRVKPRTRRVDMRKRKEGKASFRACGLKRSAFRGSPVARSAAVPGGEWSGGAGCLNAFRIRWRASSSSLTVSWASTPRCGDSIDERRTRVMVRDGFVSPDTPGHVLDVQPNAVGFLLPIAGLSSGFNVAGTLTAAGGGQARGSYHDGDCTYGGEQIPIKRG